MITVKSSSNPLWCSWAANTKLNGFGRLCEEMVVSDISVSSSHCSTVERLYAWEKKLFQEVKVIKIIEH